MSALLRRTRSVDFERLYRHHAASVYRYAYAVLGSHADAEDVTQQTFLNAYRAIAQGTKPRKAENWLLRIAHNEVRRHFRDTQGKSREVELDEQLPQTAPERSDPNLADVLRALQHLPPVQRSVLVMREFEGRSYAEIAEIMNITQSALEGQIFRARRALAEHLEGALTCAEAEDAVLRRLDGRLPRRVGRRLKAHLHECQVCVRFADVQKRQRALLKGISVMPIPASILLFRGEQVAAASLGASGMAAGGAGAVGGGAAAGAGGTGIAAGFIAKAAAVTAAAAAAGGVGYGVATEPHSVSRTEQEIGHTARVAPQGHRAVPIATPRSSVDQPAVAWLRPAHPSSRKAGESKKLPTEPMAPAKAVVKAKKTAARSERATEQATPKVRSMPAKKTAATKVRTGPAGKIGQTRPARPKPVQSPRASKRRKPLHSPEPAPALDHSTKNGQSVSAHPPGHAVRRGELPGSAAASANQKSS